MEVKLVFRGKEYSFRVEGDPRLAAEARSRVQAMLDSSDFPGRDAEVLLAIILELALDEARLAKAARALLQEMEVLG